MGTDRSVHPQKAEACSAIRSNFTVVQERLRVEPCLASLTTELMLTENLYSGFRRLLPKSLANNDAFHSLAPPPTSLQNPLYFAGSRAIDDAGFATASDGSFSPAQSRPDRVREARTAKSITGLRSQESQSGGREVPAHTNPKILINRVRKPEKRRQRAPKTAVACENCR